MKTTTELYELGIEDLVQYLAKQMKITIDDDPNNVDLTVFTQSTADGYDIHVMNNGWNWADICFDSDVYYYEIPVGDILARIAWLDEGDHVYIDDIDEKFAHEEDAIIDFLVSNALCWVDDE